MKTSAPSLPKTLKILQIEDDDDHARIFSSTLSGSISPKPELKRVENLSNALLSLKEDEFDFVFLDLGLPESDGIATLQTLFDNCGKIPAIVLTSNSEEKPGEDALKLGALDYVNKSELTPNSLRRCIRYSQTRWQQNLATSQSIKDLTNFSAVAAHDLTNSLKSIQSVVSLLEWDIEDNDLDKELLKERIHLIEHSASHGTQLVEDLLRFAQSGENQILLAPASLERIAKEAFSNLAESIAQSRAKILFKNPIGDAHCDRALIEHVFQNLLSNAIKYRGKESPVIQIERQDAKGEIVISIADNGKGIDADKAKEIFKPFTRVDIDAEVDGSGLGLSICKRIIEAHKGRMWVESTLGQGSTFSFTLPNADA